MKVPMFLKELFRLLTAQKGPPQAPVIIFDETERIHEPIKGVTIFDQVERIHPPVTPKR
jgi:hypothetical protein